MSLNPMRDVAIGTKNLAEKAAKKSVETSTDFIFRKIGSIMKWSAWNIFNVLVVKPSKTMGKGLLAAPIIPGPK